MENYTERIDQYLSNTLSAEEKLDFENELTTNEVLKSEFVIQENIMEGLKRAGIKHEFSQAIQQHILVKGIVKISGIVVVAATLATLGYFILRNQGGSSGHASNKDETRLENSAPEKFEPSTVDTVIETGEGNVIISPAQPNKKDVKAMELNTQGLIYDKFLQGLCVDNGRMYYFMDKVLYCQEIQSNKVLIMYEPNKDTALIGNLSRKVLTSLQIKGDTAIETAKERIRNFYVLNLSVFKDRVYIGVRFKILNKTYADLYYAILELDEQLTFKDYYFLRSFNPFTMPPFHALQFKDENTVYLPSLNEAKWSRIGYYEFKMNKNNHSLYRARKVSEKLGSYHYTHSMNNIIFNPVIYTVANSGINYFYHHPYPILYDTTGKIFLDPYQFKNKKDSLDNKNIPWDYTNGLGFYGAHKLFSNIILSTARFDNTVYMAVSNKDERKTDLVKYDIVKRKQLITTLDIPIKDRYFVFSGKILYILDFSGGRAFISSIIL